ncbi:zinc ribbon domain-containing protein [Thiomonas sp.]|uniref:zinc ribbon domain-containing protein n=1 Tax=Thiomonas sp. TaxID=2047785 RepID=UPI0026385589|nr:zinc ribbon domain-containing protein [Thiomonas sp.]
MSRYCTRCGAQNSDTARFCTACGVPMPPSPAADPPAAQPGTSQPQGRPAVADVPMASAVQQVQTAAHDDEPPLWPPAQQDGAVAAAGPVEQAEQQRGVPVDRPDGGAAAAVSRDAPSRAGGMPSPGAAAPVAVKGSQAFLLGGIATGVIALLLIGGGGLWWSMRHPPAGRSAAVASAPTPSASQPVAPASAPAGKPAAAASAGVAARTAGGPSAPAAETPVRPPVAQTAAVPARPEPPQEATRHAPSPAAKPRGTSHPAAPAQRQEQALPTAPQPSPAPAPVEPAAQDAPPVEPRPPGRVEALRQALAACRHKGNFFTQQLCIQEARWTYCGAPLSPDPLWGKVAECPSAAQQNSP